MSFIYTAAEFDGDDHYTGGYRKFPFHTVRAQVSRGRFQSNLNSKILVAGCGYGFMLQDMASEGFTDVWGCDASPVAVARSVVPGRVILADCTVRAQLTALRNTAGLSGNQRFGVIITEDLLPCAQSEAEAQTMLAELRRIGGVQIAHIITMLDTSTAQHPAYLWRTATQWRAIIGAGEPILPTSTYEVLL